MQRWGSSCCQVAFNPRSLVFNMCLVLVTYWDKTRSFVSQLFMYQRAALMNDAKMTKRIWMQVCVCVFWDTEIQLVSVGWMRYTACSPIPCFLEYCHPEEQNRPLVGEGWVAAGPLRGLFLQGHTHAWSEAHRGGSGTRRLYLLCLTSVTPHNTSYRTSVAERPRRES